MVNPFYAHQVLNNPKYNGVTKKPHNKGNAVYACKKCGFKTASGMFEYCPRCGRKLEQDWSQNIIFLQGELKDEKRNDHREVY